MNKKGRAILNWFLRVILSLIFLISVYAKINDPYPFWEFIERVLSVSSEWAKPALWSIVLWELLLGSSLLLFGRWVLPVWGVIGTLLAFSFVIGYALFFYPDIDCGCFGSLVGQKMVGGTSLARNGGILLVAFALIWLHENMGSKMKNK